jgi:polyisoprenoid-binding protein YceI
MNGTNELGPDNGRLAIRTGRTGVGAGMGHDLTLEPTRWHGTATVDPGQPANSSVVVEVDVDSLEIRDATGGVKPLSGSDRAQIDKTLRTKILNTGRHPTITFRSTRVSGSPESFTIDGDLTIVGVTQPVTVRGEISEGRARGSAEVVQSKWGIRPFSAFFGALKLADAVEVEFDLALPSTE